MSSKLNNFHRTIKLSNLEPNFHQFSLHYLKHHEEPQVQQIQGVGFVLLRSAPHRFHHQEQRAHGPHRSWSLHVRERTEEAVKIFNFSAAPRPH